MAPGTGLSPELRSAIEQFITENKVVAFIKGTKQFPQCGFSNTVVQVCSSCGLRRGCRRQASPACLSLPLRVSTLRRLCFKPVLQILNSTSVPYVTVNVLEDELLRSGELWQKSGRAFQPCVTPCSVSDLIGNWWLFCAPQSRVVQGKPMCSADQQAQMHGEVQCVSLATTSWNLARSQSGALLPVLPAARRHEGVLAVAHLPPG